MAEFLDILMFVAVCAALMAGFPVAFTLAGVALAFGLLGYLFGVFDFSFFSAMPQRIFGTMTNSVLIAVPLFVFMGVMLERSRVAEELLESMGLLFGTLRGGLGISVSIVGALLAASTGIVGATVVTMGLLSLPTMLRNGYDPKLACGSICAAGTLGQIIPPSIVLVLLGDVISNSYQTAQRSIGNYAPDPVSVGDLFAGALIPGIMLVGLYITYQIGKAFFDPKSSPALEKTDAQALLNKRQFWAKLLHALLPPIVLIVAVLGSILGGIATPTEAAGVGAVGALMLAGLRLDERRGLLIYLAAASLIGLLVLTAYVDLRVARTVIPTGDMIGIVVAAILTTIVFLGILYCLWRVYASGVLQEVMRATTQISAMVFIILIGAALFSLVFRGLGGEETVHSFLNDMPGGVWGAMITVMIIMFILGFFLDFIEITFVVIPVVAPVLLMMGLDPVWLGVMFALNLQTSFLTPPFGFALFYLRGVAPAIIRTVDIYKGVIPFIVIQILALLLLAFYPQMATWLPRAIFG